MGHTEKMERDRVAHEETCGIRKKADEPSGEGNKRGIIEKPRYSDTNEG